MGAGHDHGTGAASAVSLGSKHRNRLWIALGLSLTTMAVEALTAWLTGSLALLSDAAHVGTDAIGIGMALAAILAVRHASAASHRTYGFYRLEVLAALANTVLLFGVAVFVFVEAVKRFGDPPEVQSLPMILAATWALAANVSALFLLRSGAKESINLRGAYFEVLGDALSSIGVIVAAVIIQFTQWYYADAILACAVALFILPRAYRLGRDALRILLESAPTRMNIPAMERELKALPGVREVHDLHVWTLTSGMDAATVHLVAQEDTEHSEVLKEAKSLLNDGFHITHSTVQIEPDDDVSTCENPNW
ncbi:cation diffusion facilitator family transporter [Haloglycomyces albus]|uniref:cation diffusion facilitator family transporter n=1 Tax=Haloglycomyces albus TaxID=526067 RepID=UPI00046D72E9|nr:cation diffusion facilitator family transporter [Haloglycomyces albus]